MSGEHRSPEPPTGQRTERAGSRTHMRIADEREADERDADGWVGIDHVQLAIPPGGEDRARAFYVGVLGLAEVPKPPELAGRGGAWFEGGGVRLHLGVEDGFVPARRAHPALLRRDLATFVRASALDVRWAEDLPGVLRCHLDDPFGNRIELVEAG